MINIIAAVSKNMVIGKNNKLPWDIPEDLAYFKNKTKHGCVVMGRKTFESMDSRPLPKRTNIVITRGKDYKVPDGVFKYDSLEKAIDLCKQIGNFEIWIIGGAEIYKLALEKDLVDRIYLTEIDTEIEAGDTFFPEFDKAKWKSELLGKSESNGYKYEFKVYSRH